MKILINLICNFKKLIYLSSNVVLFSGNANKMLAEEIAKILNTKLGDISVGRFADGEVHI